MSALLPTYQRTDVELVKGQGSIVEDATGKTYLDFIMGIAVCNTGHRHPYIQQRLEEQLNQIWHTSNLFQIAAQERVAERLTEDYVTGRCG